MENQNQSDAGSIRISDEAIAVIAGLAALEVDGVASMSQGAVDGIAEMLGVKPSQGRGVKVEVRNEDVAIEINLLVEFGVDIPVVCQKVQDRVRESVEDMTGLNVSYVNISVQGVKMKGDKVKVIKNLNS
ncbi:Asp23/Gls24 family envelope stress response protein [bacterium]|nr:Asp23/Gls24 family envelope stress response protein [bacterium]